MKTTSPRRVAALLVPALLALIGGCKTAAPPPPPAPAAAEVTPAAEAKPAPPEETVRVTAGKLNVRSKPTTAGATLARVKKGERLRVIGRDGDWLQVKLADGTSGWVSAAYVRKDEPCPGDKAGAELLSDVPLSFSQGAAIGRVVIEATVSSSGSVASTKVVQDTTGTPELLERALTEVKSFKFAPPVRDCKPLPFVYTYTRNF
ncbi:MAG: SH3 domain-containing protein [Thermoanaerobaculaceae bacterium]